MIIDNLLDNLGIISYPDKQVEDDPNLKQGKEFMGYERDYHINVEPRFGTRRNGDEEL